MCKYCEASVEFTVAPEAKVDVPMTAYIDGDQLVAKRFDSTFTARIDYCPFCGRRLLEKDVAGRASKEGYIYGNQ